LRAEPGTEDRAGPSRHVTGAGLSATVNMSGLRPRCRRRTGDRREPWF
jgi:hypothetical protein